MDSVESARYVSNRTVAAVAVSATLALLSAVCFVAGVNRLLPDNGPVSLDIWAYGVGPTKTEAIHNFSANEKRVRSFLNESGFEGGTISQGDFDVSKSDVPPRGWMASERLSVNGTSYRQFSGLANRASKLDPSEKRISAGFPPVPFESTVLLYGILTIVVLCVSVAALEFRTASTNVAPRGLNVVMIFIQSMMYSLAIIAAILYWHVNALAMKLPFAFLAAGIVTSIGLWLLQTRKYWLQLPILKWAYGAYAAAAVVVAAALALSTRIPQMNASCCCTIASIPL